jgi:hypothetical protein
MKETEQLFKVLDFNADTAWNDPLTPRQVGKEPFNYVDKAQMLDPLVRLYSEVEQPLKLREYVKKWRSGAEMRFKLPYQPNIKPAEKTFSYI